MAESRRQLIEGSSFLRNEKEKIGGLNVKRSTITGDAFKKGTSQESAEKIDKRVGNNERKITLLKNIIKGRKANVDKKLGIQTSLQGILQSIAESVDSIRDTLIKRQESGEEGAEGRRIKAEQAEFDAREKDLEKKKRFEGLQKIGGKVLAPVKSLWERIWNFIKTIFLGKILLNFLQWISNPANQQKIRSFIRFVKDWWPALLGAVVLFGTGFGAMITNLTVAISLWIPKMLGAIKTLGAITLAGGAGMVGFGRKAVSAFGKTRRFNKGGPVPGTGDKDTVPAMLTPGEFVMSKGAVEKYGMDTLEGMNAAGGGSGIPTLGMRDGFKEGGSPKSFDKSHYGTTGYRIGQINPETLLASRESVREESQVRAAKKGWLNKFFNRDYDKFHEEEDWDMPGRYRAVEKVRITEDGETVTTKTVVESDIASIGVPDLIEHQDQLLRQIHKVEGYEHITIDDVINDRVGMPLETYLPILMRSDAQKATFAKWDEAHREDLKARGIKRGEGFSMGMKEGGEAVTIYDVMSGKAKANMTQEQADEMVRAFTNRPEARIRQIRNDLKMMAIDNKSRNISKWPKAEREKAKALMQERRQLIREWEKSQKRDAAKEKKFATQKKFATFREDPVENAKLQETIKGGGRVRKGQGGRALGSTTQRGGGEKAKKAAENISKPSGTGGGESSVQVIKAGQNQQNSQQGQNGGGDEIPAFEVGTTRDLAKVRTLGIMVI